VQITVCDWPPERPIEKLKNMKIKADIFLLCFDIRNRQSLKNIKDKYLKELAEYQDYVFAFNPHELQGREQNEIIPIVLLVGCKCDVRKGRDNKYVIPKVSDEGFFSSVFSWFGAMSTTSTTPASPVKKEEEQKKKK